MDVTRAVRKALAGTLLVCAVALAGCGGGGSPAPSSNGEASKSPQQIVKDTVKAAKGASSFRMSGQVTEPGQKIALDLTIVKGKGAKGSVTLKGHKVDLVVIGKDGYMRADAAFWSQFGGSQGGMLAQLIADRWFKFPTTNAQFGPITGFATSKSLFDQLASDHGRLTKKGATTYKGQSVVGIVDHGPNGGTLYVAATGSPYPVAIAGTRSSSIGSVSFDNWNESVALTAPSGAIDFSQFIH